MEEHFPGMGLFSKIRAHSENTCCLSITIGQNKKGTHCVHVGSAVHALLFVYGHSLTHSLALTCLQSTIQCTTNKKEPTHFKKPLLLCVPR